MSDSLRSIVRKHAEDVVLRNYLGKNYNTASPKEKKKYLKSVETMIEQKVETILRTFVEDIQKDSPERKRRKNWAILLLTITGLITPGIAYAVNIENWALTAILSVVLLAIQGYNVILEN